MKISKVIEKLQELEKSYPDAEVSVGNIDILFIEAKPCYYDGPQQVLVRDESINCYNVIGAKYKTKGTKIDIFPHSIEDALLDETDLEIDYSELGAERKESYQKQDELYRQEAIDAQNNAERDCFIDYVLDWCKRFGIDFSKGNSLVCGTAKEFFDKNLDFRDKMPEDIASIRKIEGKYEVIPSWNERRALQWNREISISYRDRQIQIQKKA